MLFDPKWNKPSLDSLIAWLETKNATETYYFSNCRGMCMFGQYMTSIGISWDSNANIPNKASAYCETLRTICPKDYLAQEIARGGYSFHEPEIHTFGAALARAKAFKANQERN